MNDNPHINNWMADARCLDQSDDLNWMFFGQKVINATCDNIGVCFQCWPRCCYCWSTCYPDGECENDEFEETGVCCPTATSWIYTSLRTMDGAPPWFRQPYVEAERCAYANPWRPSPRTAWRAPMVLTPSDTVVYYPQALEAFRCEKTDQLLRSCWMFQALPSVGLRLRFRDARATWRNEWQWGRQRRP